MIGFWIALIALLYLGSCTPHPPSPEPDLPVTLHYKWLSKTHYSWWNIFDSAGMHREVTTTTEPYTDTIEITKVKDRSGIYCEAYNSRFYRSNLDSNRYDLSIDYMGDIPYQFAYLRFSQDTLFLFGIREAHMNYGKDEFLVGVRE